MNDPIDILSRHRPAAPGPDPLVVEAARGELLGLIEAAGAERHAPTPKRRTRRRLVPVVIGVLVATTGAAYQVFHSDPETSTSLACSPTPDLDDIAVIPSASGDPLVDCRAAWLDTFGVPAPELSAYVNDKGGIVVVPAGSGAPAGATPLPDGFRQDAAIVQLTHELGDMWRGIGEAACRDVEGSETIARRQLARLGLAGWEVVMRGAKPDGVRECALARIDPDRRRVVLSSMPAPHPPPSSPFHRFVAFSRTLSEAMVEGPDARCLGDGEAHEVIRQAAASAQLEDMIIVRASYPEDRAPDGKGTCVRAAVNVGGSGFVYLESVTVEAFEQHRLA